MKARILHILILGTDNEDSPRQMSEVERMIQEFDDGRYANVSLMVTYGLGSLSLAPEELRRLDHVDLVYLRTGDGRPLEELEPDIRRLGMAICSHPSRPPILLDKSDGGNDYMATLNRYGQTLVQMGVDRRFGYVFGVLTALLEQQSAARHTPSAA